MNWYFNFSKPSGTAQIRIRIFPCESGSGRLNVESCGSGPGDVGGVAGDEELLDPQPVGHVVVLAPPAPEQVAEPIHQPVKQLSANIIHWDITGPDIRIALLSILPHGSADPVPGDSKEKKCTQKSFKFFKLR